MIQIISNKYHVTGIANSMQGGRPENQDDMGFVETPLGLLLVLCDGMGGGPGGKTASYIAKYEVMKVVSDSSPQASPADVLKKAVARANESLEKKMKMVPELRGMGSTLVAILINEKSATIVHLGDSRCYKIRDGKVLFRTDDNSLVGELVRNKAMTEEQARLSPQSNVITRGLGSITNHVPVIDEVAYHKGDRFVLCSDGVWGVMPHEELVKRFTAIQDVASLVSNLSAEVDRIGFAGGGGHDNHTLVMVEMNADSILKDKMSKLVKIIVTALACLLAISMVFNVVCLMKLGSKPQDDALKETIDEVNRLRPYEVRYKALLSEGNSALHSMTKALSEENDSLREELSAMASQIDNLERELKEKEAAAKVAKPVAQKKAPEKNNPVSPLTLAQRIVNQFDELKNITDNDQTKAARRKAECRDKIVQMIDELDKKTSGKFRSRLNGIRSNISGNSPILFVQKNKDGSHSSTKTAIKGIEKLKSKMQDIVKELKK